MNDIEKKRKRISRQERLELEADQWARALAFACVRTSLERFHEGTGKHFYPENVADAKVVIKDATIPWKELSRISQEEMQGLMVEIINKLYTALLRIKSDDQAFTDRFFSNGEKYTAHWNDPEYLPNFSTPLYDTDKFKEAVFYSGREQVYTKIIDPSTICLKRWISAPIEHVWDYLTESKYLNRWLASTDNLVSGLNIPKSQKFTLYMDDKAPYKAHGFIEGIVLQADRPKLLSMTWHHLTEPPYKATDENKTEIKTSA